MQLNVKLRDGFRDATVEVTVDGKVVFDQAGVTSDLSISTAAVIEVEVGSATVVLEVKVSGGPTKALTIHVGQTPFVDVWNTDAGLDFRVSAEEVPML